MRLPEQLPSVTRDLAVQTQEYGSVDPSFLGLGSLVSAALPYLKRAGGALINEFT